MLTYLVYDKEFVGASFDEN